MINENISGKRSILHRAFSHLKNIFTGNVGTDKYLEAEPWGFNSIVVDENSIEISGFALPPIPDPTTASFTVNGQGFDHVEYPIPNKARGDLFWQRANADQSGFICRKASRKSELFKDGILTLEFQFQGQPKRFWFDRVFFFKDPDLVDNLPEPSRRYRVIGTESMEMFILGGVTDFMKMDLLLREVTGKGYGGYKNILDWGCGCGRVSRHFSSVDGISFYGADVDHDNAAWCSENLGFGNFRRIPLHPPTDFDTGAFDLIYGISVFTHLHEDVQLAWLEELKRISAPGATLLMTIHGATALNYAGVPKEPFKKLRNKIQEKGFVITSSNDQINDVIDDKDYYINVMHSKKYIRENWGKHFEIIDIIPGFIYTHDVVVMRKLP